MTRGKAKLLLLMMGVLFSLSSYSQTHELMKLNQLMHHEYMELLQEVRGGRPGLIDTLTIRHYNKMFWGIDQKYAIANIDDGIGTRLDSLLASGLVGMGIG